MNVWSGLAVGWLAGLVVGALVVNFSIVRPLRRERNVYARKTGVLVAALRPFAPVKVRKVALSHISQSRRWHYWACGSCSPHGLLGGPGPGQATLARTNDDAREHFLDEHLTREHIERAGEAMAFALDSDRWWKR